VTLAHKDIFDLPGRAPGLGLNPGIPDRQRQRAAALDLLAKAGAQQSATLSMAPLACGATGQNPHFERVLNPIDPLLALGGSSSGSAAAVAAGLSYFSLGTDTAGSVRIPAATCAILGLKTTHGLIDTTGCAPLSPSLDSIGILSRHVDDARLALQILAPSLPASPASKPLRLRFWLPESGVSESVRSTLGEWTHSLQAAPCDLTSIISTCSIHAQRVLCHEVAQTHRAALLQQTADPAVQSLGWLGLSMPDNWYLTSMNMRATLLKQFVHAAWEDADLLALPALPLGVPDWDQVHTGQPRYEARQLLSLHHHMGFVNYLGLPALNLPVGLDERQRPVCVQLLARPYAEHLLLDFARQQMPQHA
jgi:aspartyl-tRNA(Asn)/glutamyl-tRNA(Gln) amidotransferase subunit A